MAKKITKRVSKPKQVSLQDYIVNFVREDNVESLLHLLIEELKRQTTFNPDFKNQINPLRWAKSKIEENKIGLRLLRAYKKNPLVMSQAVKETEQLDLLGD